MPEVFQMFACCKRISGSFRKQLPEDLTINIHSTAGISAKIVASCCTRLCDIHSAEIRLQHRALSYRCNSCNLVVTSTSVTALCFIKKKKTVFQWLWAQLMLRTYCVDESAAVLKPRQEQNSAWDLSGKYNLSDFAFYSTFCLFYHYPFLFHTKVL